MGYKIRTIIPPPFRVLQNFLGKMYFIKHDLQLWKEMYRVIRMSSVRKVAVSFQSLNELNLFLLHLREVKESYMTFT